MDPIICPKCSHEQDGGTECQSCGVIFARYQQILARKAEAALQEQQAPKKTSHILPYFIIILALISGGAGYFYLQPATEEAIINESIVAEVTPTQPKRPTTSKTPQQTSAPIARVQKSSLQRATHATVQVRTSWGSGSGFFITESFIVTNKHVIRPEPQQLQKLQRDVSDYRKLIRLEKEKLTRMKNDYRRMQAGPSKEQLKIIITRVQEAINAALPQLAELEERLARMTGASGTNDLKIVLIDGTEYSAYISEVSEDHDLALLSTSVLDAITLPAPQKSRRLQQGEKVYTIGSPRGLSNTVTAGVFSAYRIMTETDNLFLQVDAPINPGNSGGPLVDEKGNVQGVNTMILTESEGIGFAIPIETVMEEFGASLY